MFYREIGSSKVSMLGYGCMRFPVRGGKIDEERAEKMLLRAYESGVNYFDTAYNYHDMQSEPFVGRVFSKLDRDTFFLATKFPTWKPESQQEARDIFEFQMKNLQTDHIDFYLMHALTKERWEKINALGLLPIFEEYQRQGRIRHLGFSFHDSYEVFEQIINARKWDFCQLQFNYMDTEEQAGLKGLRLAESLGVSVVVMEPVKGGVLAKLPEDVAAPLHALRPSKSDASWAMRFVESQSPVKVILSGMSTLTQVKDNLSTFSKPDPLTAAEAETLSSVAEQLKRRTNNGCTGCRYCMPCPNGVAIPRLFRIWNEYARYGQSSGAKEDYASVAAEARADRCIKCGKCETMCPQHIDIRGDLARILNEDFVK